MCLSLRSSFLLSLAAAMMMMMMMTTTTLLPLPLLLDFGFRRRLGFHRGEIAFACDSRTRRRVEYRRHARGAATRFARAWRRGRWGVLRRDPAVDPSVIDVHVEIPILTHQ